MPGGATYGAAADFNKFAESDIRWVSVAELREWQVDTHRPLVLLDVRDIQSFESGSIPGARSFPQGSLFINWQAMQTQIDEVVTAAAQAELVLFANTGGAAGPSASRDLYGVYSVTMDGRACPCSRPVTQLCLLQLSYPTATDRRAHTPTHSAQFPRRGRQALHRSNGAPRGRVRCVETGGV
uniref:Rhodanese domain-containing protein n=1 Tax=Haptolina brevifila TaxID=156173 RepID=A0A7S2CL21_9EUKA|mmetsp:Transcript_26207/g.52528  ORF Transcript_26207/g.52528 Transcript_26207/m.52528 type:complete len:182 (+) Transcript_26207:88-633(+)